MVSHDINLLKANHNQNAEVMIVESIAQKVAWWGLLSLLVIGLCVGGVYAYAQLSYTQVLQENEKLHEQINAQHTKEGMLITLKKRATITQKVLDVARPWGRLFPLLLRMASPEEFSSFDVDIAGRVSTQFVLPSVDDAITIVRATIALQKENVLKNSELSSLIIKDDGTVRMGISFFPTF
jgi:hypothetical protein